MLENIIKAIKREIFSVIGVVVSVGLYIYGKYDDTQIPLPAQSIATLTDIGVTKSQVALTTIAGLMFGVICIIAVIKYYKNKKHKR